MMKENSTDTKESPDPKNTKALEETIDNSRKTPEDVSKVELESKDEKMVKKATNQRNQKLIQMLHKS